MRDGEGNKLSPEEQQKVQSIQGTPDRASLSKISIDPHRPKAEPPQEQGGKSADKPDPGAGD